MGLEQRSLPWKETRWKLCPSQEQRDFERELRGRNHDGCCSHSRDASRRQAAWVKEQEVRVADGRITEYQVNLLVTFVLDE